MILLLTILPFFLKEVKLNGGYMMRVPGLEDPIELSSKETLKEEIKMVEGFKDLPPYKAMKLLELDPSDP